MPNDTFHMIDALEDLLDKERAAILKGAFEDMGRIAGEKERVLGRRELTAPDQRTLDRVKAKAARNQQLLAAAIRGVRAVTARLDVLRNGPGDMNTYDRSGQRATLSNRHQGALHRRA